MKVAIPIINIIGACLFGLFAWFQLNDDNNAEIYENPSTLDVVLWACFYAYVAILHGVGIFRPVPIVMLVLGVLAALLELSFTAPGLWANVTSGHFTLAGDGMRAAMPEIEQSREFLGAAIALGALIQVACQRRWWAKSRSLNPLNSTR